MGSDSASRAFHNARLKKNQHKVSGAFAQALSLHQRGMIADAQVLYRGILQKFPTHFETLHHLGVAECQSRRFTEADRLLGEALGLEPHSAAAHCNRGIARHELKRYDEALASFDTALAIRPDYAEAFSNRGNALTELGRFEEAVKSYDAAIAIRADYAEALSNRGNVLKEVRRFDDAVASCDKAIALRPGYADALSNRGNALVELTRFEEAAVSYQAALAIKPDLAAAWLGLGNVLLNANRFAEAYAAYGKALAIKPDHFKALALVASCFEKQGRTEDVIACYDRVLAVKPDFADAISNRIFALDFAKVGLAEQQEARANWWREVGAKIAARSRAPHANSPDTGRRIVLGYVSSDFRQHSAATAIKPVLANHDKARFEVICYACSIAEDNFTGEFQRIADRWRNASQWSDARLAEQIRADQVDILIDLSGHSAGHRLGVFAAKPAPVQVTAWGHATGTGLATIDYLFSDPVAIPQSVRHLFAETIYDLPCLITMEPPDYDLEPTPPPVLAKGYITFGAFNRVSKISDEAVAVWAQILHAVPRSRLAIKDGTLGDASLQGVLRERFARHGIAADRLDLLGPTPRREHLAAFRDVDIGLDPFPQNGGISTWEAVHMGVPVVAKLGTSPASRLSGAILSAIGMSEWVAGDVNEYRAVALKYASMPDHLRRLRRELPARISASAAGNPALYAEAVEAAYTAMWHSYVRGSSADGAVLPR